MRGSEEKRQGRKKEPHLFPVGQLGDDFEGLGDFAGGEAPQNLAHPLVNGSNFFVHFGALRRARLARPANPRRRLAHCILQEQALMYTVPTCSNIHHYYTTLCAVSFISLMTTKMLQKERESPVNCFVTASSEDNRFEYQACIACSFDLVNGDAECN